MPINIRIHPNEYELGVVTSNSNEALALKAVRDAPGGSFDALRETVPLSETALTGALYRLRKKALVVRDDEGRYDVSSYAVFRVADALVLT
jgi:predicted transcriptional regulator